MRMQSVRPKAVVAVVLVMIACWTGDVWAGCPKTAGLFRNLIGCKQCGACGTCWCPDNYCPKPPPCFCLPPMCGCCDDYCPKPMPCFCMPPTCGCCDDYCPKPPPCILPPCSCGGDYKCPPPPCRH